MTVDKIKISIAMSCSPKGDCGIGLRSKYAKVQRRNRRHSIINIHVNNKLKYSLQGTTQSRYLTGGVPPVRFSM